VEVQEVRWDKSGTEPADDYTFFYGNGDAYHHLGAGFPVHEGTISTVKKVEYVSDKMSYLIQRGRWCDIFFLNVHEPAKEVIT
jgi:hypothetical protein